MASPTESIIYIAIVDNCSSIKPSDGPNAVSNATEMKSVIPAGIALSNTLESDYLDKFGMKQNGDYHHIVLDFYKLYIAISERVYGKNQVVKRIDKDITRLECDMQNEDMITSFVLGFGDKVKVIEPEWLKERIIDVAKKIIENGN